MSASSLRWCLVLFGFAGFACADPTASVGGTFTAALPLGAGDVTCVRTIGENFYDGYSEDCGEPCPDPEPGAWPEASTLAAGEAVTIVVSSDGEQAELSWGDLSVAGRPEVTGWSFTVEAEDVLDETAVSAGSDYEFTSLRTLLASVVVTFELAGDDGGAEGTVAGDTFEELAQTEADEWTPGGDAPDHGAIESAAVLVYKEDGETWPLSNEPDEVDCKSGTCELSVTRECDAARESFTATRVSD